MASVTYLGERAYLEGLEGVSPVTVQANQIGPVSYFLAKANVSTAVLS